MQSLLHTRSPMENEQIDAMSKLLKSMSHPIRLKILCLLQDHEMSVGDIREQVKNHQC